MCATAHQKISGLALFKNTDRDVARQMHTQTKQWFTQLSVFHGRHRNKLRGPVAPETCRTRQGPRECLAKTGSHAFQVPATQSLTTHRFQGPLVPCAPFDHVCFCRDASLLHIRPIWLLEKVETRNKTVEYFVSHPLLLQFRHYP